MKINKILALLLLLIALGAVGFLFKERFTNSSKISSAENSNTKPIVAIENNPIFSAPATETIAPPALLESVPQQNLPKVASETEAIEFIKTQLPALDKCLKIESTPLDLTEKISDENIIKIVENGLGQVILTQELWSTTDIRVPSGEVRRILFQDTSENDDGGGKHYRYIAFRQGTEVDLELTEEQSLDPSDAFIASLEKDGEIISKANLNQYMFSGGGKASVSRKNGRIDSFQFSEESKTFSCQKLSSDSPNCLCNDLEL